MSMDSGDTIRKNDTKEKRETGEHIPNFCNVLPTTRIRCSIRVNNEIDRILLDYGYYILLYICPVLWALFYIFG